MSWIESHQELLNHPKTITLSEMMGWDMDQTVGKLHRFWWWCVDYAQDGDLRRFSDAQIAYSMGVAKDDAKKLIDAMVNCGKRLDENGLEVVSGFIDRVPYFRVHDWWDTTRAYLQSIYGHTPEKWQRIKQLYYSCNTTSPNLTKPNQTKPEKEDSPEPKNPASGPERVVLVFPTVGRDREWVLTEGKLAEYRDLYPNRDVLQDCKQARQWCVDNPGNRKTAKGMTRFLSAWLSRAVDRPKRGDPAPVLVSDPERRIIAAYKLLKGISANGAWDHAHLNTALPFVRHILSEFGGIADDALDFMEKETEFLKAKGFEWNLKTLSGRVGDYRERTKKGDRA